MKPTRYRKILVPIDFSQCSSEVAAHAADVAAAFGAEAVLLHIDELPSGVTADTPVKPSDTKTETTAAEHLRSASTGRLARFLPFFEAKGVSVAQRVDAGKVTDSILAAIEEVGADLVIMGTHGRRGMSRLVLGSVAETVMRQASCPVMTVRTMHKPSCEAAGCSWCASDVTDEQLDLEAESVG
jgi:universal stress protein A